MRPTLLPLLLLSAYHTDQHTNLLQSTPSTATPAPLQCKVCAGTCACIKTTKQPNTDCNKVRPTLLPLLPLPADLYDKFIKQSAT